MSENLVLKIKKLDEKAILPKYARDDDAAMDVTAVRREIQEGYIEYGTGLALEVPKGYVCLIFPRSSVTKKGMMLKNSVGVLDSGYRGELILRFQRTGGDLYEVGERIGQIMLIPHPYVDVQEVSELSETTRGEGGFGSTGK